MSRLPDHDLSVLVETAAESATNSWAAHKGGTQWKDLTAGQKNLVRETALPFLFHGTKALADLGYVKPRTITTADELDALKLPAIIECQNGGIAKVEYMAGPGRQKYAEFLFGEADESHSLVALTNWALPAQVLKESAE